MAGRDRTYYRAYSKRDPQTNKVHERQFSDPKEADAYIDRMNAAIDRAAVEVVDADFGELCDRFLDAYVSQDSRAHESTARMVIESHLRPYFGERMVRTITGLEINAYFAQAKLLSGRPMSKGTKAKIYRYLRSILNRGSEWGMIPGRNPIQDAKRQLPPTKGEKDYHFPDTEADTERFLQHVRTTRFYAITITACFTGCREGELLPLEWGDIWFDEEDGPFFRIVRTRNFRSVDTKPGAKTDGSERRVYFNQDVADALIHQRDVEIPRLRAAARTRWKENNLVFPSTVGTPQWQGSFFDSWRRQVLVPLGMEKMKFQDLRAFYITNRIEDGYDSLLIAAAVGNSPKTIDKYYFKKNARTSRLVVPAARGIRPPDGSTKD